MTAGGDNWWKCSAVNKYPIYMAGSGYVDIATCANSTEIRLNKQNGTASTGASVGFYDGGTTKVGSVDSTGKMSMTTYATQTNCSNSAAPAVCAAAPAGSVVVAAAATTVVVNTTAVTANSQILLQNDSGLGTKLGVTCNTQSSLVLGTPRVTARTAATSFTITLEVAPTASPMCISYSIVN